MIVDGPINTIIYYCIQALPIYYADPIFWSSKIMFAWKDINSLFYGQLPT